MKKVAYSLLLGCSLAVSYTVKAKKQKFHMTVQALEAQKEATALTEEIQKTNNRITDVKARMNASISKKHTTKLMGIQKRISKHESALKNLKSDERSVKVLMDESIPKTMKEELRFLENKNNGLKAQLKHYLKILAPYMVSGQKVTVINA